MSLSSFIRRIDQQHQEYNSRKTNSISTHNKNNKPECECLRAPAQRALDTQYYHTQKQLVDGCAQTLGTHPEQRDRVVVRLLQEMSGYLDTILSMLSRPRLCSCMSQTVSENLRLQHNLNFLRSEHDKLFRLFEQKTEEVDSLKAELARQTTNRQYQTVPQPNIPEASKDRFKSIDEWEPQVMESRCVLLQNQRAHGEYKAPHRQYFMKRQDQEEYIQEKQVELLKADKRKSENAPPVEQSLRVTRQVRW